MKDFCFLVMVVFFIGEPCALAQTAQDCSTAIPICNNTPVNGGANGFGIDDFNGLEASGCLRKTFAGTIETNAVWYRFRTTAPGQFGFNIAMDASEDWDFALYKTSDCSNLGEPVRCNLFDNRDRSSFIGVGEDPSGDFTNIQYEDWLDVAPEEDYYLLINNFSDSDLGFSIQFSGDIFLNHANNPLDCTISTTLLGPPIAACGSDMVTLDATTSDALAYTWYGDTGSGFQEVLGANDATYEVSVSAMYRVVVARSPANLVSEVQVAFSDLPAAYAVTDDAFCSRTTGYDLSIKNSEVLGIQNPNAVVVSYHASLNDAISGTDFLPIRYAVEPGAQTIYVRVTSVENPNCFDASQSFELINLRPSVLGFKSEVSICDEASQVTIGPTTTEPNYSYEWDSGETTPNITVSEVGKHSLTLTNMQAGLSCSETIDINVTISSLPSIATIEINDLQKNNTVAIITNSKGNWQYQINDKEPQEANYFSNVAAGQHTVHVIDPKGCGSVSEAIVVAGFPKFFTPNGDGFNDRWTVVGLEYVDDPVLQIYDRYGRLLSQFDLPNIGWDGTFEGQEMPSSDYWFRLTYSNTDGNTIRAKHINNHFTLRR